MSAIVNSEFNKIAPQGQIWQCGVCGQTSRDRYALDFGCVSESRLVDEVAGEHGVDQTTAALPESPTAVTLAANQKGGGE